MGKSSSSSKKIKRSKDSSKLRSVKKKKTKRNKSKKIRRIKDYSDESESSGSDSSLYSSSEDDYRRDKHRSRVSKKKRSGKRYSTSESDDDDDNSLSKKKKRSKRKDENVETKKKKKKIGSRKRRKRDVNPSSTSSESCSVRDNKSSDGSESDGMRRTKDRGKLDKVKTAWKRTDESEEDSEPDDSRQVEAEVMREKNPRRLKSIVVVSYTYGNDDRKEDMVDDHDVSLARGHNEESDEIDGETTISYHRNGFDDSGRKVVGYDDFDEINKSETSKASHPDSSLKDDDLEAILKKRALENLKRFREVTERSAITRKDVSFSAERETLQSETEIVKELQDHSLMEQKLCVSAGKDLETSQKILQAVNVKESGTALAANPASPHHQQASSGIYSCTTKRKLIRPILRQQSVNLTSRVEAAGCQDAKAESINGSTIDKNSSQSSVALATKNGGENNEPTKVSSTLAQSSSHADSEVVDEIRGESLSEQKTIDETKDESQYEQKTMTVMRGGELVEVSYKVYIPKKTSSLGRRQLKR